MPKIEVPTEFEYDELKYIKGFRDGSNQVNVYGQHPHPAYAAGHRAGTAYREKEEAGETECARCAKLEAEIAELQRRNIDLGYDPFAGLNRRLDELNDLIDECRDGETAEDPPVELLENPAWR